MNLVKFQDTKAKLTYINLLHFYILTIKLSDGEIKEIIPFAIASKRLKYLGTNLPKKLKDLRSETVRLYDRKRWKTIPCS